MNTSLTSARVGGRVAVAAMMLCIAVSATAGEIDYRLSLGAGHSDNVNHAPTDEVDQDIATAGLRFAFDQDSARVKADIIGDLAYYEYLDNAYDSDLVGNVDANALFALLPDRITWAFSEQFGQSLTDPFRSDTPDNRENINYFSTGPDFIVGLGSQMRLRFGARYALANYEVSPLDSASTGGQIALVRVLSDRSSVSLNASLQQVEYDEAALNSDFDQSEAFIRYDGAGARTNLKIDAGYSQLDSDASADTEGGAVVRVDASRKISASSTLVFVGGHEFATTASSFANSDGGGGFDTAPGRQTADPFTYDHASLGWTFNRNVTGLGVTATWSKNSYDSNPVLDQTLTTISARFRREMSPRTSLQLSLSRTGGEYEEPAPDYDELIAGASFSWRLARDLTIDVRYDFTDRNSDDPTTEYSENRIWLTVGFGRGEPRSTRVAPTFGVDAGGN
jgi:hypothetical protein